MTTVRYREIFWTFFKIGSFTIGGGYAMIPMMEDELVTKHHWMDEEEFADVLSMSQALPGVFAVNMAAITGNRLYGFWGSVAAIVGNIIMPVVIVLALAIVFRSMRDNVIVGRIFMGLRPAVVALIVVPVIRLAKTARLGWSNCWIPILATAAIILLGISPVWVVLGGIVLGLIFYKNAKHLIDQ